MYIRQCFRTVEGKRRAYWALVESVRTERGPRQNVVAWLGALDEVGRLGVLRAARCIDHDTVDEFLPHKEAMEIHLKNRVVTQCGMPLGYEVFAGNTADVTTVKGIVEMMERQHGKSDRIWVMDHGMTSEDNLEFLR